LKPIFTSFSFIQAFHEASITKGKPTAILAKTLKGKGFYNIEDAEKWHGTPLNDKAINVLEVNI